MDNDIIEIKKVLVNHFNCTDNVNVSIVNDDTVKELIFIQIWKALEYNKSRTEYSIIKLFDNKFIAIQFNGYDRPSYIVTNCMICYKIFYI